MSAERVRNWTDTTAFAGMLATDQSQAEWDLEITWHTWLAFRRRHNLTDAPRDGGPQAPRSPRAFRVLSWAAARTTLQPAATEQLTLLGDVA